MRGVERRISVGVTDLIFRVAIAVISKGITNVTCPYRLDMVNG